MSISARSWLLLFVGLCGFFGLTAHGYVENTDVDITMHAARAMVVRGEPGLLREGPDTSAGERYMAARIHEDQFLGMVGRDGRAHVCFSIGHQLMLAPCIAVGEQLTAVWPGPAAKLQRTRPPLFGDLFWSRFLISFISPVAAAGSVLVMLAMALGLGASRREALLVAGVAALCTQFWPASRESLSDGPGMFFLLAAVLGGVRYARGLGGRALLWGGAAAGCAVLVRYPHMVLVSVLTAWLGVIAYRRGSIRDLWPWIAGGAPAAVLLLVANAWRFGDPFELAYTGADESWWSYPLYLGIPLILLAPGKGVLWFSPPLWPALSALVRRPTRSDPVAILAGLLLVTALLLYGRTHGWHGSQCWGVRYLTPTVVLAVVVGLTLARPWRRRPRLFAAVCVVGLLISLGGVLTPYRGQQFLADQAARTYYAIELERGDFAPELLYDRIVFDPRFSPLHTHWLYAWASVRGALGPGSADHNTEPVFGIAGPLVQPVPAFRREDLGFRHLWWLYLGDLLDSSWPIAAAVLWWAVTATLLWFGVRRFTTSPGTAA